MEVFIVKKLITIALSMLILISLGLIYSSHSTKSTYTLSQDTKYISEDFHIIEVSSNGEIRGEKIQGTGEGIFLLADHLPTILNAPDKLTVGDEIQVAWTADDYTNEVWDNIQSIELIN